MKKMTLLVSGTLMFLCAASAPVAQDQGPPKVLRITREEVKPGRGPAHAKIEAGWPRAFAKHNWPVGYIAMTSIAGANEAWYMTPFPSFAAMEQDDNAIAQNAALTAEVEALSGRDGEMLSNIRNLYVVYRPDLSHNARSDMSKTRYVSVTTFRLRLGREAEFAQVTRLYIDIARKFDPESHWASFQVVSGMPVPTILVFSTHKSLGEIEPNPETGRKIGEAIAANPTFTKLFTDSVLAEDSQTFAISPAQSYVTKEFAGADSDFWHPKPKAAPAKAPAKAPN